MQARMGRRLAFAGAVVACLAAAPAVAAAQDGTSGAAPAASPQQQEAFATVDNRGVRAPASSFDRLAARAAGEEDVEVIVGLRTRFTPEPALRPDEARDQRAEIDVQRASVLDALKGTRFDVLRAYEFSPFVALSLSPGALRALERSGRAATLSENRRAQATLAGTTAVVEATESAALGRSGSGKVVAVIDTGVDKAHSFLAGKVVSEACYSSTAHCPGGVTASTAGGSGVPCTFNASRCQHGTHVAGIAAGKGSAFSGVARDAKLIAINAASKAPSGNETFTWADVIKALERVYALRSTHSIASVNLSIGTLATFTSACDSEPLKPAIDNLRAAGIATVIASGNSSSNTGVSSPACISTAITVGNTTDADAVNSSSNSSSQVELLAPGTSVNSSIPGGGFGDKTGTSMAAPHVAGAWAVLKAVSPSASVPTVLGHLQATGKPVTDADNSVTKPRIRLLSAGTRFKDTGFRDEGGWALTGGDVASNGIGLATRAGGPASGSIVVSGIPAGAKVEAALLYWMTIGGPDASVVFKGTVRAGTLVGASRDSCWSVNQLGANRTYVHRLPVSTTPGNGSYSISGVGGAGAAGQGASLVLVYSLAGSPRKGIVRIRHGAMTVGGAGYPSAMTHSFTGLSVPATPSQVRLHTGVADGQVATENPMLFAGSAVTPAGFFSGKDGKLWDDDRTTVSPSLLPTGTTSRSNLISIPSGGDCLAWGYSALAYQY